MSTEPDAESGASSYEIRLSSRAEKDLDGLKGKDYRLVDEAILGLTENPRPPGCKKISGNQFRVRTGNWRIIYVVYDDSRNVVVSRVRKRNEATYKP